MDRPRVLIVDSHAKTELLVRKILGKHCDLIFQATPRRTLDALVLFEPDLVILELELPELGGFELISLIHDEPAFHAIPIMVFSAAHDVEIQKLAYRLGVMHFQAKPCRPSQLFKAAAMFYRTGNIDRPAKRLTASEAEQQLAQRTASYPLHPLLAAALAAHERSHHDRPGTERSVLAQIVNKKHP